MTTQAVGTRTVEGRELPPPGRYRIDPTHSQVEFVARHMMIARTRGRFRGHCCIERSPRPTASTSPLKATDHRYGRVIRALLGARP